MIPEEYEGEQVDPRCARCEGVGTHICARGGGEVKFEVVYRKTFSTDDADPICDQSDERIVAWFVCDALHTHLMDEGFGLEVVRERSEPN